jgi:molybdenum cofactor cytidylyltransferase
MEHRFGAAILAAGRSSRMGQSKLLLRWGAASVIEHLIRQWRELGASQVAVVLAEQTGAIAGELDRIGFPVDGRILNPNPEAGMYRSIQCAASWDGWRSGLEHLAVVLGDQPHLRTATLQQLRQFARLHPREVCQPGTAGRPFHPVFLPWGELHRLSAAKHPHLRAFLRTCRVAICEVNDPGLALDLDTPADYQTALRLAFPQ